MTEILGNVEIATDYSSFKPIIDSTAIERVEQIETLNYYLSENQVVFLDGPKNIGKSTLLSQFLNQNQRNSIAVFLNEANTISLIDNDIYKDIYIQIRIYTNEFCNEDLAKDIQLKDIIQSFRSLSYYLRVHKKQLFFLLDGFEKLANNQVQFLEDLLFNLPQTSEVKFLVSTSSDIKIKSKMIIKNSTIFNVPVLSKSQIQLILPEVDDDQLALVVQSFYGKPDSISIIARLMKQGVTIDEILQNPSQETNALYFAEWDIAITNGEQEELIGYLAFSNQTININDLCVCCNKNETEIIKIIESISFIQISAEQVDFVSYGYKKLSQDKLIEQKPTFLDRLIHLIKSQKVSSTQTNLTIYLKENGDNRAVIDHINDNFILDVFENTHSINELQKNVSIGLNSSIEIKDTPKSIKYSHIKCAFSNINTSYLLVNELKSYLKDNDLTSAISLIESSKSNEEKLQLYCVYSIHYKEQKIEIEDDIKVKIDYLFDQINIRNLGDEKALDIASDLFPVFPEKSMKLINELDSNNSSGQNKSDHAFLKLSLETLKRHGNSFSDDLDEFDGLEDKKSKMFSALKIFNPDSPIAVVTEYIDKMTEAGDRIFIIRAWLTQHYENKNAILLLEKVLELIICTTTFSSDAALYFDLSRCLTNNFNDPSETLVKRKSYERVASQLETLKLKGPTIKYCQLVLIIKKFEIINEIQNSRIEDLIQYVINIGDKSISLACLSIITKFIKDENIEYSNLNLEDEKNTIVERLLSSDGYHVDVFKDAIRFESQNNLINAIIWSQKLNTQPRQDKTKAAAIESYCDYMNQQNMSVSLNKLLEQIRYIKDESFKPQAYKALVRNLHKLDLSNKDFKEINKVLNRIENRRLRAKCLVDVARLSIKKKVKSEVLESTVIKIEESIGLIDGVWNKIDTSYYVYSRLLNFDKNTATKFKELAIKLRNENEINNQYVVEYLINSISLSIRSIYTLAEFKLDDQGCLDLVIHYIEKIPSEIMRAKLFARLASAYQKTFNVERATLVIEKYLIPLLKHPVGQVSEEYNHCLNAALPIFSMYKTPLFIEYLDKIGSKNKILKDRIILKTINYYYRDCLIEDTYESIKNHKYTMVYSDLKDVVGIITLISEDSSTLYQIQELLEVISSSRKNNKITGTQQNDLIALIVEKFDGCFPKENYIKHDGYKILFQTFIEKFRKNTKESWEVIIEGARCIPNTSDRAFTLLEISKHIGGVSTVIQKDLIKEADLLIDSLTSNLEKINRYSQICEYSKGISKKIASSAIRKALEITSTNDIDESSNARLNAIDIAYKLGDSFASSLSNIFDDDPARQLSIKKEIEDRKAEDENKRKFEKNLEIENSENLDSIYKLAWKQLGELNSNSCHIAKGFDISKYIESSTPLTIEQFYMILSYYIHYLSKAFHSKENVRNNIRPIFDELMKNISTVLKIYSTNNDISNEVKTITKKSSKHIIINEGDINVAIDFIKNWYVDKKCGELTIVDPYFSLNDLSIIGDVIDKDPEVKIKVLSSKESLKKIQKMSNNDFDDIIAEYWNDSVSTSSLPPIEFIFVNYGNQEQIPIHDRWWLTSNGSIHTGTSVNGFAQRISQISVLDLDDRVRVLEFVEPFLQSKQRYYQEQRVKYQSFRP